MRETTRARLAHLENTVPPQQRRAVEAMRAAGLDGMAARMGGDGAVAWVGALPALFEGIALEDVQRIADGEDPDDVLVLEQLAAWEQRSAAMDTLERELTDPA